jgi:ribosomal protein L18E
VKVLGNGEISKKLTVRAHGFSGTAKEKIEAAGGTCEIVESKPQPGAAAGKAEEAAS